MGKIQLSIAGCKDGERGHEPRNVAAAIGWKRQENSPFKPALGSSPNTLSLAL